MTIIHATLTLIPSILEIKLVRNEVACCRVGLAPGGALCCATVPTQQDRLASVLRVSTFPRRTASILLGLWGRRWANHRKWKWEGKSDGAGCTLLCFAIALVMKCRYTALQCGAFPCECISRGRGGGAGGAVLFLFSFAPFAGA